MKIRNVSYTTGLASSLIWHTYQLNLDIDDEYKKEMSKFLEDTKFIIMVKDMINKNLLNSELLPYYISKFDDSVYALCKNKKLMKYINYQVPLHLIGFEFKNYYWELYED